MSYYPRQFPVLEKTVWQLGGKELDQGTFDGGTAMAGDVVELASGSKKGIYISPVIDPGQQVAWKEISWEADVPEGASISLRTRTSWTAESLPYEHWTSRYTESPSKVKMISSREGTVKVAADRFMQVMFEMKAGPNGGPRLKSFSLKCGIVPPACVGPMNHSTVESGKPTLYWTRVEGSAGYEIQLSNKQDFSSVIFSQETQSDGKLEYPGKLNDGAYFWRARAKDGSGQWSEWSTFKQFNVGKLPEYDTSHLTHPYLYFSKKDIPEIKQRLQTVNKETWDKILAGANEALEAELRDEKDTLLKDGQHGGFHLLNAEVAHNQLLQLAFVYQFTGDEKYAAKAREVILWLSGLSRWTGFKFGDASFAYPTWCGTLETSGITKHVATAYDWLYDYLSEDDRLRVRNALIRNGALQLLQSWADPETIRFVPRHQVSAGNWWSVCNGGGGITALALINEVPDAKHWVRFFSDAMRDFLTYQGGDVVDIHLRAGHGEQNLLGMEPNWGEDGGYIESIGYAHYAFMNSMYLMEALKRVTGIELAPYIHPKIQDTPLYFGYYTEDGEWNVVHFNDDGGKYWSDDALILLANHTHRPIVKWIADNTWPVLKNMHAVIAKDDSVPSEAPDPQKRNKLFSDIGWCVFRSSWDKDTSMMAAKFTEGRGHNDIGQYVINYQGKQFIVDSGIVPYDKPQYGVYSRTTQGHNVVMIDDKQQIRIDGKVLGFAEAPGVGIVEADLTNAYQDLVDSWKRTLVYLEPDVFVVIDRLEGEEERKFDWLVHPGGEFEVTVQGAVITKDNKQMALHLASTQKWNVDTRDGFIKGEEAKYLAFTPEKPCREVTFVGVFAGSDAGGKVDVQQSVESGRISVEVKAESGTYVVTVLSDTDAESISTLAVAEVKSGDGTSLRWAVAGNGTVKYEGKVLDEASSVGYYRVGVM